MMRGAVNARCEAVLRLAIQASDGSLTAISAIVDTGFTASLALPVATVQALGLVRQSGGSATLADGSVSQFEIFAGNVEWNGQWRRVLVSAVGNEALVGMRLLRGHDLRIHVAPGGVVEIA